MAARSFDSAHRGVPRVHQLPGQAAGREFPVRHFLRPRLTAIAPTTAEAVQAAGGWLFDRVMEGWDVTVVTADCGDPRPLRILGVRPRDLDTIFAVPVLGPCLRAVAVPADLYESDERVRRMVLTAAESGGAEVRLWGDVLPPDFACTAEPVSHRLSLAARAFKGQALNAATLPAEQVTDTEAFHRAEVRRSRLVSVR